MSCKTPSKKYDCEINLENSKDVFNYPDLTTKSDTDIFVYQLKDTLNERDSFVYVNDGINYLKKFNEPNLSLRFIGKETFRFTYAPFGGIPINISFNSDEFIVKTGQEGSLEPIYNMDKLDSSERLQFNFLERNFFTDKSNFSLKQKKRYDSVINKYPELLSIKYYKHLLEKALDNDSLKFIYTTKKIHLTKQQYCKLIDSLKRADFGKLSWRIDFPDVVRDGGGYTFEANTKTMYKYFVCYGLPISTLPMTNFCRYLLSVAKLEKEIKL